MATSIGVKLGLDGEAEFRKGLNNTISSVKSLDKQMSALESSFDGEKKSIEENQKQTELLEKKKAALEKQIEETSKALEYAKDNYEENSKEVSSWEGALADAEKQLNETNEQLADNISYDEEQKSALGQLTTTISEQESQLDELRQQYLDTVVAQGDSSEAAEELADRISELSGELNSNQQKLDDAKASLNNITQASDETNESLETMEEDETSIGDAAGSMAGMFNSSIGSMVSAFAAGGLIGGMMELASAIVDAAKEAIEMSMDFEEAENELAVSTGLMGDDLASVKKSATEMWAAINDEDMTEEEVVAMAGNLNTRLGATGEQLENLTWLFEEYAATLGVDGADAVNDLVDVMQKWGLTSEDNSENAKTLTILMDELSSAQSLADVSVEELANSLKTQSGTYQELGMDIEDAIGFMVAYRDAGGEVSEITRGMDQVINNLAGETDNLDVSWADIINTLETSDSKMDALSHTVTGTSSTIEDVLGKKLAGKIYDTFSSAGVNADEFTSKVEHSQNTLSEMFTETRTDADQVSAWFKENFTKKIVGSWTTTTDEIEDKTEEATDDVKKKWQAISDLPPSRLSIEVPVVTYDVTGSGADTKYTPAVSYKTYARAYDQAMILSSPTIFGAMNGNLLVGGDRPGNEIVVGEEHLLNTLTQAVKAAGGPSGDINVYVYGTEGQNEDALADAVIEKLQEVIERKESIYG